MRVLLSAFQCGPGEGSELGNAWRWAMALNDLGHEVTVLTPSRYRDAICAKGPQQVAFSFVDLPESPLGRISSRLETVEVYSRWQSAAFRHVEAQQQHYDVAHHVAWGSLHLGSVLWRLKTPLLYGPIGGGQTAPGHYWRYFGRDWPAETLRTMSTRSLLPLNGRSKATVRNSAVTLVTNSATAAACRRLGAADVRYMLAEGLPSDWLASPRTQPSGLPVVLWVGRLLPRKAPTLAIESFAALRKSMSARLVMAGDGPLREQVRDAVDRLGLAGDVDLLGQVSWSEVKTLCDSASVFLFTSLRDSSGAQFLEALGRGLPAVALDHHGIGDADTGAAAVKVALPARPDDLPALLASALQQVLTDGEWESRSASGIEWAAGHIWPAKAAAASRIYEEIA